MLAIAIKGRSWPLNEYKFEVAHRNEVANRAVALSPTTTGDISIVSRDMNRHPLVEIKISLIHLMIPFLLQQEIITIWQQQLPVSTHCRVVRGFI